MLAHSPPLPLTVDYSGEDDIAAEDQEGMLLALEQRHRVRHLRLAFPDHILRKLVMAIDKEFPILEYLIVYDLKEVNRALLVLPETLQTPHLRHLLLRGFDCPIRPRLSPTAAGLVTLCLAILHPPAYFQPDVLVQWISFLPQLESVEIAFTFPVPNSDVLRQLTHTPITTHITHPNLRDFGFRGDSAYLEAIVCRIMAPRLETMQIRLFRQPTFSVPHLPQFMKAADNLKFDNAKILFMDGQIYMQMFTHEAATYSFGIRVDCRRLDWQVSSVAQISNALSRVLSTVERLILVHDIRIRSSEELNDVDRMEWRNLLRSFSNVKTLRVENRVVKGLSDCLRLEDGEEPLELLPELQELTYFGIRDTGDAFTPFIDARQNAGHPVTLVCHGPSPSPSPVSFVPPAIAAPNDEARNDIEN